MAKNKKNTALDRKQYSFSLSAKEVVGWLTLLVFVGSWFFVLGIVVGRWYVPVSEPDATFPQELLAARQQALARADQPTAPAVPLPYDNYDLDNHDPVTVSEPETVETKKPSVVKKISGQATLVGVDDSNPTVRSPTVDTAIQVTDTAARFTIQIAALKDRKTADQLLQKLQEIDFPAYVTQSRLADGSVWFRIRCGEFADRRAADPVMTALRQNGYSPLLVKK